MTHRGPCQPQPSCDSNCRGDPAKQGYIRFIQPFLLIKIFQGKMRAIPNFKEKWVAMKLWSFGDELGGPSP